MHIFSFDPLLIILPNTLQIFLDSILKMHSLVPDELRDAILVEEEVIFTGVVLTGFID